MKKSNKAEKEKELLYALINYADKSHESNPHFFRKDMVDQLGWSEQEFNIAQQRLGNKYCPYVDIDRFRINISECLSLKHQYAEEKINENRHEQLIRIAILVGILGAVMGFALSKYF